MTDTLTNCPFCGGALTAKEDKHGKYWEHDSSGCPADTFIAYDAADVAAWNRRVPSPEIAGVREALEELPDDVISYLDEMDDPEARRLADAIRRAALASRPAMADETLTIKYKTDEDNG